VSLVVGRDELARVRGTGREGLRATRPVSGPRRHSARLASDFHDNVMISERSTRTWEAAYRQYGCALETTARCGKHDPEAAQEMARTSRAVAAAWRQIAAGTTLPWWTLAAIESAAGAFECQAREYETGQIDERS
jgi:hypothetical protein